jgi:hypothetical protein
VERLIRNELNKGKTQTAIVDRVRELCRKVRGNTRTEPAPFAIPTMTQVADYMAEKGYTFDLNKFYIHYTTTGWRTGSARVHDWKALVDGWNLNEPAFAKKEQKPERLKRPPSFDLEKLKERANSDDFYEEIV